VVRRKPLPTAADEPVASASPAHSSPRQSSCEPTVCLALTLGVSHVVKRAIRLGKFFRCHSHLPRSPINEPHLTLASLSRRCGLTKLRSMQTAAPNPAARMTDHPF